MSEHQTREEQATSERQAGSVHALAETLVPLLYKELKRVARYERWRVGGNRTLQTTELVSEAWIKLRGSHGWNDDAHFLRAAALAMRHVLVNRAEARAAAKRGGGATHLSLTAANDMPLQDEQTVLALNEALQRLALESPRLAGVVECRYFGGYDEAATARALGLSERTVRRDWALARAWLHKELHEKTS